MDVGSWLSVIIPAFQERDRITTTLAEIENFIREYPGIVGQVIVVDDASRDGTMERVVRFKNKIPLRIEAFSINKGKWAAIRHGISMADFNHLCLLDADGSASIVEVAKAQQLGDFLDGKVAIFGSRFTKGATIDGKPVVRSILSAGYRTYVRAMYYYVTGKRDVDDMQCPFKLFRKSDLLFPLTTNRFTGDLELACSLTVPVVNHPVQFMHRLGGSIKPSTVITMARETFNTAMKCHGKYRLEVLRLKKKLEKRVQKIKI